VASSARLGEISRVYVAAGIAVIDDCSTVSSSFSCRKGVFPTTMRIDDPVARWYPDWPVADTTTVRQLLDGSSGLAPVTTDLADLAAQMTANPGTDWSRRAVLARAIAAPRRFTAGARNEPVDTEWLLLEAIIERASGKPSSLVIPTEAMAEPFDTTFVDQPPIALMAGRRADGSTIADLDPKLLALLGNAGGMAAPSADLAEYALTAWATTETLNDPIVNLLTDAAGGHALPLGAAGVCPCDGSTRFVIRQIGHAVGWSTILAYDFQTRVAVGVAIGTDVTSTDLDTLLQSVIAIPR
jgi:CubicO group peptidase (beta-lactamase class C family)